MARRAVYKTRKDADGDILALCNDGESWSPRSKQDAIKDIDDDKTHQYYVPLQSGAQSEIHVVNGPTGRYLRTDWDQTEKNNLDDLPDC